jgi:dipeptidyl aminopeptidase/acylaminoacyl peptidase
MRRFLPICCFLLALSGARPVLAVDPPLKPMDIFDLEYAADPQISPDGTKVVFVRNSFDLMKDRGRSRLWMVNADGSDLRPLTSGAGNESSPRWSPDGKRLAYVSDAGGSAQLYCLWLTTRETAKLTDLTGKAAAPAWSPDGKLIAFAAFVEEPEKPFVELPAKPAGAEWALPAKVIRDTTYRFDGLGYLKSGRRHLFVVPAEGGAARQLTSGPHDHCGARFSGAETPAWFPDGKSLVVSGFRGKDAGDAPNDSALYEVPLAGGELKRLTDQPGPAHNPTISPDGKHIAFIGFEDKKLAYQQSRLYVMKRDGSGRRVLAESLDRDVSAPVWDRGNRGVYVRYPERGDIKVSLVSLDGKSEVVAERIGGTDIGRPYSNGSYSVSDGGSVAATLGSTSRPADVGIRTRADSAPLRITKLNENLLGHRSLGAIEEIWFPSPDGKKVQGWLVTPSGLDPKKKYPLILEIHGGPYADYGPTFAAEIQLYAAAGYVVLYVNPRGSTGYGEAFAQAINGNYPGPDYDDLMAGVDAAVKKGFIDEQNLFVTGGSGGGVLTAWIVGKTDRFRAAVSCKPVINWESFVLTADMPGFFANYWLTGMPWDKPEEARKRSPLSLVGKVKTPTMLLTGEADYRTPISESEQFYTALKLRGIDTALVRFPEASHAIVDRPSRLIAKTLYILKWFNTHAKR